MARILVIRKISLIKLIDGGPPIFITLSMNHINDIDGIKFNMPLVRNILRVWVVSYVIFAMENIAEETSPWATIRAKVPIQPHKVFDISPEMRIAICPTEEYAIKDFISVCRRQIILVIIAPHRETLINIGLTRLLIEKNIEDIRSRPYLPSFKRTAARIMDPATGASTCALGNHKWVIYIGIFTINAIIVISHQVFVIVNWIGSEVIKSMEEEALFFWISIILISKGREAVIVYIIK